MPNRLEKGVYELLLTNGLADAIAKLRAQGVTVETEAVEGSLLNTLLRRHVGRFVAHDLERADSPVDRADTVARDLGAQLADGVSRPTEILRAVRTSPDPFPLTSTPLSVSALMTGAADEPRLGLELVREIGSADSVDALVSFVTWEGWRRLSPALEPFARRGGRLRLLTTTYIGATDAAAVAAIAKLPGAEVRVSYDGRRTRLHAKAWLFRRASAFSTAWVGSANLSGPALTGGLEWTLKASAIELPDVLQKFAGTFETLWNDTEFEAFDPEKDVGRLQAALESQRGRATPHSEIHFFASLKPFPFQQEILEALATERAVHGRSRNLVVAATGTGKTLVSAFDYAAQPTTAGLRPRLLFVAHREELLTQALEAFRHVLRDGSFGQQLGGGYEPTSHDYLFTTVQSLVSRNLIEKCGIDHWDYVVVDECHHSTAETYSQIVDRLQPKLLLGLTATPERADGQDITRHFDGRVAAEIRLWHALERQLLAPFEYFGLADQTSLSDVSWSRSGYTVAGLDAVYSGNDRRAELVLEQYRRHRGNLAEARTLGFCVSVAHAKFMAAKFSKAGVPALAVHGDSTAEERRTARSRLETRQVNVVFTCDLYNEGVDLPFVDSLLFLRPTNSATVFLQQLGRGLRLHEGKTSCLVLDFIGQCRQEFRFDRLFAALTGLARGRLGDAVAEGFPTLPSGCSISLDRVAQGIILENIRESVRGGPLRLAEELRQCASRRGREIELVDFLEDSGRELSEVYAKNVGGFTSLRSAAGLEPQAPSDDERELAGKLGLVSHVNDPEQLRLFERLGAGEVSTVVAQDARRLQTLGYQLWHTHTDRFGPREVLRRLSLSPRIRAELGAMARVLRSQVGLSSVVDLPTGWELQLHRAYQRREVLTAVGAWTDTHKPSSREGLVRVGDTDEVFFVTLVKDERRFSPTTRYRDYAISPTLFHWQSQSGTAADGRIARRYATNSARFWLFVRRTDAEPFSFLGRVRSVACEGTKPVSITWRLDSPMPASMFQRYASLVAA